MVRTRFPILFDVMGMGMLWLCCGPWGMVSWALGAWVVNEHLGNLASTDSAVHTLQFICRNSWQLEVKV